MQLVRLFKYSLLAVYVTCILCFVIFLTLTFVFAGMLTFSLEILRFLARKLKRPGKVSVFIWFVVYAILYCDWHFGFRVLKILK